jgi:hypothetical protein
MRRALLLLAASAALAGDAPRPEEALAAWLESEGVKGAELAIKDREILRASRPFFRDKEPFLLKEVREALDAPLAVARESSGRWHLVRQPLTCEEQCLLVW